MDKSNVLRSYAFFRRIFTELAANYPGIKADYQNADAATYQLVTCPERFAVLVAENFIREILSDVGAGTVIGLGKCPAATISDAGAYFEPACDSTAVAQTPLEKEQSWNLPPRCPTFSSLAPAPWDRKSP